MSFLIAYRDTTGSVQRHCTAPVDMPAAASAAFCAAAASPASFSTCTRKGTLRGHGGCGGGGGSTLEQLRRWREDEALAEAEAMVGCPVGRPLAGRAELPGGARRTVRGWLVIPPGQAQGPSWGAAEGG